MAFRRAVVARPGKKIDFKSWTDLLGISLSTAAASTILGTSLAFGSPATILRMRGQILLNFDAAADNSRQNVGIGIGIISSDAFAAGAGSVPDPLSETDYPWLWWSTIPLVNDLQIAGESLQLAVVARVEVDSKAMRKVKPGQSLAVIYQTSAAVSATNIQQANIRVLIGT